MGDDAFLLGGVDNLARGALYRPNLQGIFEKKLDIVPVSSFPKAKFAASFEAFSWGNGKFASYIVLDDGDTPSKFAAEVWLTDLSTGASRVISGPQRLNRLDPEFFLGSKEAFILHYARDPAKAGFGLYRLRTGL